MAPPTTEIAILLHERVELNAMTSDALIAMIERKLKAYGLEKVIPDDDVLGEAYQAFHRSQQLRVKFQKMEDEFEDTGIEVPENLTSRFARSLMSTAICAGTTQSRSCWTRRSSIACGQRSKRPKRNPATSRTPTMTMGTTARSGHDRRTEAES